MFYNIIDGIESFMTEGENILLVSPSFNFAIKNKDYGEGTLFITTW